MILQCIQVIIPPFLIQQLRVAALFNNLTMGQQNNIVRMLNGREPVSHDQHSADILHFFQTVLNQ